MNTQQVPHEERWLATVAYLELIHERLDAIATQTGMVSVSHEALGPRNVNQVAPTPLTMPWVANRDLRVSLSFTWNNSRYRSGTFDICIQAHLREQMREVLLRADLHSYGQTQSVVGSVLITNTPLVIVKVSQHLSWSISSYHQNA